MSKIGIIGSGVVSEALAAGFLDRGYEVMRSSRDPRKLDDWDAAAGARARTGTFAEAAAWGDLVVLAVQGRAAEQALALCGPEALAGKTVIDTTNPIAEEPADNGVLRYFTDINHSLMERLQEAAPEARFVKAFSCVGNAYFVDPDLGGWQPTMFICGDDDAAKSQVREVLVQFGWDIEDMGGKESARAIEPLCMLWCIPGLREGRWRHALTMIRGRTETEA